jgi:4-amino-4-deoxy-L-arabinose transferase-like glycosyltransferase
VSSLWLHRLSWAAIAWIVVFWRLGYKSLLDPDEAHYAELTREMLHAGNWLVPLLDGKPFIDKPVLFHWLQGISVMLLGESEFAARLPTALAALVLFAITRWVGGALFGLEIGYWGAIMFATIPATFALSSIALFDMVFAAFLFGAVGCLLVAAHQQNRRIEYSGYALLTLAVMTKGPVAIVLTGAFLGAAWIAGGDLREFAGRLRWKSGLALVVVASSPWFLWMDLRFGREFVQGYILAGNLWYFTQPEVFSRRAISHTFYARAFAGAFFPWSLVVVGHAIDVWRGRRTGPAMSAGEKLLWLWALVVIGFFSLARFKLDHYIFPAAPACCLIAAHAWRRAADQAPALLDNRWTKASIVLIAALLIVGGSFGSVYLFELNLELPAVAVLLPLALLVGGTGLLSSIVLAQWRIPRTATIPVITLLACYVVGVAVGYPVFEQTRPTAAVAKRLRRVAEPDAAIGLYRLERWRSSLRYYVDRPIVRLETPEDVLAFVSSDRPVYVVLRRNEYDSLRRGGAPIREVMRHRAVIGTSGRGLRRQQWGYLIVARSVRRQQGGL